MLGQNQERLKRSEKIKEKWTKKVDASKVGIHRDQQKTRRGARRVGRGGGGGGQNWADRFGRVEVLIIRSEVKSHFQGFPCSSWSCYYQFSALTCFLKQSIFSVI